MKKVKERALLSVVTALVLVIPACSQASNPAPQNTPAASTAGASTTAASTAGASTTAASTTAAQAKPLPTTITMFNGAPLTSPIAAWDTPVGKKIQELTGVNLQVEYLVGQDIMTKANLMVSSGVYPDVVAAGDNSGIFIAGGAFIPLDDLINQYGDNIKKIYRPKELALAAQQNQKTYIIPTNQPTVDNLYPSAGYYMAYDVLKQAGFPVVKSLSQYVQLIKDYVAKNPTYNGQPTIGFTLPTDGSRVSALQYGGARFIAGYPNDGPTAVDQDTLEAKVIMTQPFMKDFLKFCNDLWNEGLMDPETFMQKDDQYLAKIAAGRVIGLYDQRGMIVDGLNGLEKLGDDSRQLVAFPVTFDNVQKEYYRGPYAIAIQGVSITTACKDPEGVFRFFDMMCSDDIQKLVNWGIEGTDYTMNNGQFTRTNDQWQNSFDTDYQKSEGITQLTFLPHREMTNDEQYAKFDDGNWVNPAMTPEYNDIRYKPYEKQILQDYNIKTLCDFFNPAYPARYEPGWAVRQQMPQDSPEFIAVQKALDTSTEWNAKLIQAAPADFDGLWNQYQTLLNAIPNLHDYETEVTKVIQDSTQYYGS